MRTFSSVTVIALIAVMPLSAQGSTRVGLTSDLRTPPARLAEVAAPRGFPRDSLPRTEWRRGATIGGAIGFAFGVLLAQAVAGNASFTRRVFGGIAVGLVTALPTTVVGGLIGSMFSKD